MNLQKNTLGPLSRNDHPRWLNLNCAVLLAVLILVPTLQAQADKQPPSKAWFTGSEKGGSFYSMKFDGGRVSDLEQVWKAAFTNDNFVVTESAERVRLPAFEIRNVRLTELAQSIAFLTEGELTVEVVDQVAAGAGNIWRIGRPSSGEAQAVKMRAVAAPHLFADQAMVKKVMEGAKEIEREKIQYAHDRSSMLGGSRISNDGWTSVIPLSDQNVFVVIGTENGVAGIESFIQASEQAAIESAKATKSGK